MRDDRIRAHSRRHAAGRRVPLLYVHRTVIGAQIACVLPAGLCSSELGLPGSIYDGGLLILRRVATWIAVVGNALYLRNPRARSLLRKPTRD